MTYMDIQAVCVGHSGDMACWIDVMMVLVVTWQRVEVVGIG